MLQQKMICLLFSQLELRRKRRVKHAQRHCHASGRGIDSRNHFYPQRLKTAKTPATNKKRATTATTISTLPPSPVPTAPPRHFPTQSRHSFFLTPCFSQWAAVRPNNI
jgi:hypothetical protein